MVWKGRTFIGGAQDDGEAPRIFRGVSPLKKTPSSGIRQGSEFLRVCAGEVVAHRPVWLMRQAGRILQPYRDLKQEAGSLSTLFNTPELAAQVTLMPVEMLGVDAAILFADIFTPIEPMGCELTFQPGPVLKFPVRARSDVDRLHTIDPEDDLPHVRREIELVRAGLPPGVPLIGFAGAPVTLATYLAEGTGAREFTHFRRLLHAEPDTADLLLTKLTDVAISYLKMQVDAGVEAVQLFDTWIGQLSEAQFERIALPFLERIFSELKRLRVPTIYFAHGSAHLLPLLPRTAADVFSIDWRTDIRHARDLLGPSMPLQGNLDPAALFAPREQVVAITRELLDKTRGTPHIFNLGHGVHPETPIDSVRAMIDTVHGYAG